MGKRGYVCDLNWDDDDKSVIGAARLLPLSVTKCTNSCRAMMPPVSLNRSISAVPPFVVGVPRLDVVGKENTAGQSVML